MSFTASKANYNLIYRKGHSFRSPPSFPPGSTSEFIFRSITSHKNPQKRALKKKNKPMLYTTSRELFLQVLQPVGIKAKLASLNILWLGGASSAANAVLEDSIFKQHGRWKFESSKNGYVEGNLQEILMVSKKLVIWTKNPLTCSPHMLTWLQLTIQKLVLLPQKLKTLNMVIFIWA